MLPYVPKIKHLVELVDGRNVVVLSSEFNASDEGLRVFIGTTGHMQEVTVNKVATLRDGGTTNIDIAASSGYLYLASPFNSPFASLKNGDEVIPGRQFTLDEEQKKILIAELMNAAITEMDVIKK